MPTLCNYGNSRWRPKPEVELTDGKKELLIQLLPHISIKLVLDMTMSTLSVNRLQKFKMVATKHEVEITSIFYLFCLGAKSYPSHTCNEMWGHQTHSNFVTIYFFLFKVIFASSLGAVIMKFGSQTKSGNAMSYPSHRW